MVAVLQQKTECISQSFMEESKNDWLAIFYTSRLFERFLKNLSTKLHNGTFSLAEDLWGCFVEKVVQKVINSLVND